MIKNVTIVSVTPGSVIPKRDGGTYTGTLLTYIDPGTGQIQHKGFHQSVLQNNPTLATKLHNLQPNTTVGMHVERNGNFSNVVDFTAPGVSPAAFGTTQGYSGQSQGAYLKSGGSFDVARVARQNALAAAATAATALNISDTNGLVEAATALAAFIVNGAETPSTAAALSVSEDIYSE